ncbi:hypothetical protein L596_015031 [Steinernema carpocapsae]|uniref:Uncharacterized protein n=1 Tax=Steinernema carpocapsae TaxID=34508 RepID=A0A4V6A2Y2_STECR|nr:hypothetical protein L596_015031 [Steinernema carpocapsae]
MVLTTFDLQCTALSPNFHETKHSIQRCRCQATKPSFESLQTQPLHPTNAPRSSPPKQPWKHLPRQSKWLICGEELWKHSFSRRYFDSNRCILRCLKSACLSDLLLFHGLFQCTKSS